MSRNGWVTQLLVILAGMATLAGGWWLLRKMWLVKEGTEAEPPATPAPRRPERREEADIDPVDEAIAESFPASDPPSYAGAPDNGNRKT